MGRSDESEKDPKEKYAWGKRNVLEMERERKKKRKTKTESVDLLMKNGATPTFKVGQILFESR